MSLGPNGRPQTKKGSSGRITAPHYGSPIEMPKLFMTEMSYMHQLSISIKPTVIKQPSLFLIIFLSNSEKGSLSGHGPQDNNYRITFLTQQNFKVRCFLLVQNTNANMLTFELLTGLNSSPPKSTVHASQTINTNKGNLYTDRTLRTQAKLMQMCESICHAGMWQQ